MNAKKTALLASLLTPLLFTQCVVVDENGTPTQLPGSTPSYGQPLTAQKGSGEVVIREGSRVVMTLMTAAPNVEETRFINGQEQIAVKSRGNHGPATVQLFNSRNGREEGRVMAYEIRGGQPAWAAGMGE